MRSVYFVCMDSLDVLYYSLAVGVLVLVGFISYMLYHVVLVLKDTRVILRDIEDTTADIKRLKDTTKQGLTALFGKLAQIKGRS